MSDDPRYTLRVTGPAERQLARLAERTAVAIVEFMLGPWWRISVFHVAETLPVQSGRHCRMSCPMCTDCPAFERHGFIWGAKWYHYDSMHFEYRPELLPEL